MKFTHRSKRIMLLLGILALAACTENATDSETNTTLPAPIETYGGVATAEPSPCGLLDNAVRDAEQTLEGAFAVLDSDPQRALDQIAAANETFAHTAAELEPGVASDAAADVEDRLDALTSQVEHAVSQTPTEASGIADAVSDTQAAFVDAINACPQETAPTP